MVRRPEVRAVLARDLTEAFRQGAGGPAWDIVLLGRPWGFRLEDIATPVFLWQGGADTLVTPAMGRYLAATIPNCRAQFLPAEGHLLVIDRMPEIIRTLRYGD